jgi:hypothetical protein
MESKGYEKLTRIINEYQSSIDEYAKLEIDSQRLLYIGQNGVPKTPDDFKAMADAIITATKAGEEYSKVIRNTIIPAQDFSLSSGETAGSTSESFQDVTKRIDNLVTEYQRGIDKLSADQASALSYIEQKQVGGFKVVQDDYLSLLATATEKISELGKEKGALDAQMKSELAAGTIQAETEEWDKYQKKFAEIDGLVATERKNYTSWLNEMSYLPVKDLKAIQGTLEDSAQKLQDQRTHDLAAGYGESEYDFQNMISLSERLVDNYKAQQESLKSLIDKATLDHRDGDLVSGWKKEFDALDSLVKQEETKQFGWEADIREIPLTTLDNQLADLESRQKIVESQI